MQKIAVYHWWPEPEDPSPHKNLRAPVLLSIATLRAVSDVPIVLLQSENEKDWGDFPTKLNFHIENIEFSLTKYQKEIAGYRHLSRIFDINKWSLTNATDHDIVYVDSDVFFFQDPFPLSCETTRFCWNGWNTGFFYYNQKNHEKFFYTFDSIIRSAIYCPMMMQMLKDCANYDAWYGIWDEMVLSYMKIHYNDLFNIIPDEEHVTVRNVSYIDSKKAKIFHANGTIVSNPFTNEQHARGLLCLVIEEFYQNMLKTLSEQDILDIFGQELLDWSEDKRFSLIKNCSVIQLIKNTDGHYDLTNFTKNKNKMKFI